MACTGAGETHTYAPTNINDLTVDVLEDILRRVSSPVFIVRAAATCRPWRQVIGGAGFLRRFPSLHRPRLLGHFAPRKRWKVPLFIPAATPPGIPPIHFCMSKQLGFLADYPDHQWWVLSDSRDGLLSFVDVSRGILVCDPFTCEKIEAALPPWKGGQGSSSDCFGAFLLDHDADDTGTTPHMARFRVLCVCMVKDIDSERYIAMSYVFSSRDKQWLMLSRTDAGNVVLARLLAQLDHNHAGLVGRVAGSIFWYAGDGGNVLELDECTGEFSVFLLPSPPSSGYGRYCLRVVAGDARTLRLVRIVDNDLEVLTLVRRGGACLVDRRCSLTRRIRYLDIKYWNSTWMFWDTTSEVGRRGVVLSVGGDCSLMFSLNIETMWMNRVEKMNMCHVHERVVPYELPLPPTIRACLS